MPFLEQRISTAVRRNGTAGGPTARRVLHRTDAGIVGQVSLRSRPVHRYRFDFGNKTLAKAEEVRNFFYVVMFGAPGGGAYDGFRVRDWNDYQLNRTNSRIVGGQVHRVYSVGAAEYLRPIHKIADDVPPVVWVGASPSAATVDADTGLVTGAPDGATIVCHFDVPVTFASDDALAQVGLDGNVDSILQAFGEIELEELPIFAEAP